MKVVAKFLQDREIVGEYLWDNSMPAHFSEGVANAIERFKIDNPHLSMFEITICFDNA